MYHGRFSVREHAPGVAPIQETAFREEDLRSVSSNSGVRAMAGLLIELANDCQRLAARKGHTATHFHVKELRPNNVLLNHSRAVTLGL